MTLYNQLQHSGNPQAAVQMVISLLEKHSPKEVAEIMGISVRWVYTLRKRYLDSKGDISSCLLKRGPASPMPNRTPLHIENLVVNLAKESNLGPQRLAVALLHSFGVSLSPFTVRNILRRYGVHCRKYKTVNGNRRYAANLSEYTPFEFWQIDAKHIADQSAFRDLDRFIPYPLLTRGSSPAKFFHNILPDFLDGLACLRHIRRKTMEHVPHTLPDLKRYIDTRGACPFNQASRIIQ